jgi:hypothetical protein
MSQSHSGRPHIANLLELERRMPRIALQKLEVLVGKVSNIGGQSSILAMTHAGQGARAACPASGPSPG